MTNRREFLVAAGASLVTTRIAVPAALSAREVFDVGAYGAKGDGRVTGDGAMFASSTALVCPSAPFAPHDVGKAVAVMGAGADGSTLSTTIEAFESPREVALAAAAGRAVNGATVVFGTCDAAAVQSAVDAAVSSGGGSVFFPATPGSYVLTRSVNLVGTRSVEIRGSGDASPISLVGTHLTAFRFPDNASNTETTFRDLRIVGTAASEASEQQGIGSDRSQSPGPGTIIDCLVERCDVSFVNRGIYIEASQPHQGRGITIRGCHVHLVVGTSSGHGYGIVVSNAAGGTVVENRVDACQRHAIYVSRCRDLVVERNVVTRHRDVVFTGAQVCAVAVARSSDVIVSENVFDRCADGALSVEPDEDRGRPPSRHITVIDNVFASSIHHDLLINNDHDDNRELSDVLVVGNTFRRPPGDTNTHQSVRILQGKRIRVAGNLFSAENPYTRQYCVVYVAGVVDAHLTDEVVVEDNTAYLSSLAPAPVGLVEIGASLCSGRQRVTIRNNRVDAGGGRYAIAFYAAAVGNEGLVTRVRPDVLTPPYGTSIPVHADQGDRCRIVATDGEAFTIRNPTNAYGGACSVPGMRLTFEIRNGHDGPLGPITWGDHYELRADFVRPAPGKQRWIEFTYTGVGWEEVRRSEADADLRSA